MFSKLPRLSPIPIEIGDHIPHNCHIKTYPDGSRCVLISDRAIFRERGWEQRRDPAEDAAAAWRQHVDQMTELEVVEKSSYKLMREDDDADQRRRASLARAKRRARVAVRDLALSNDFRWFVTLTLDQTKIDRYDIKEITRHLNHWLDNQVRRCGLRYVLVPEHHKDGAVHFHGLFSDALPAVDSGHKDKGGHPVFNLPRWDWGFSTAIELYGERASAVGYVCKYITKAQTKIGGRWYYSGGELRRPEVCTCDVDWADYEGYNGGYGFQLPELGAKCVKIEVGGDGDDAAAAVGAVEHRADDDRGDALAGALLADVEGQDGGAGRPRDAQPDRMDARQDIRRDALGALADSRRRRRDAGGAGAGNEGPDDTAARSGGGPDDETREVDNEQRQ